MTALPLILSIHVDREPTVDMLDLAFARLGGFLDAETETLEALGEALSLPRSGRASAPSTSCIVEAGIPIQRSSRRRSDISRIFEINFS
jgi:hypothetical protein